MDQYVQQLFRDGQMIQKLLFTHYSIPEEGPGSSESTDSDSDWDPDEYESSDSGTDDDYVDSEEEEETDLTHIDPQNIIGPLPPAPVS